MSDDIDWKAERATMARLDAAWERAELARRAAEDTAGRFREASDRMETLCDALGEVWDRAAEDVCADEADEIEAMLSALEAALAPWRAQLVHLYRVRRESMARYGRRAEVLLGVQLPALKPAEDR